MNIVAAIGLEYVELSLTDECGKKRHTIGHDLSSGKIQHYLQHVVKITSVIHRQTSQKPEIYSVLNPRTLSKQDWYQPPTGKSTIFLKEWVPDKQ